MHNILTSKDKRFLLVCAVVAAASVWIGVNYFYKAFPEASVNFNVSQSEAKSAAEKFLADRGANIADYRYAGVFGYDDSVKTFLEKDMGLEQANALLGTKLHLWRWANRWFLPMQKEEYEVSVTTRGEIARYSHLIPEEREGASLDTLAAKALAENFLTAVMGRDLSSLEYVESEAHQRPKRMDYTFTWKEKDWSFHDASHRVSVEIDGDKIGAYNDFVHVPETWMRSYRQLRATNGTASVVDGLFMGLLMLGMLMVFVQRLRRKDIRWRAALTFGVICFVLTFLSSLNAFSLVEFGYATTQTYASFITLQILFALAGALGQAIAIAFFVAGAESLYREYLPDMLAVPNYFKRRTIRTKSFFISVTLGLTLTCFFFAYQTIFYLIANSLGAWSPADVPFDNLMNTKLPWLFVLIGGFFPAVFEEFVFRVFAIPFLQKLFKMRWLAIVLAAFIWGFGHAGYPNEPFFIRGLEVGIAGVIIGFIMLRYGILATLVWHYTVDALYSAILMIRSGNPYYMGSGALSAGIMLVPLAICIVAYLRHKSFADETDLSNAHEGVAPPLPPTPAVEISNTEISYTPLTARTKIIGLVIAAACCALMIIPATEVGDELDVAVTRSTAEQTATQFLKDHGGDPAKWRTVTTGESKIDHLADRYILDHRDVATLNTVYGKTIQPAQWRTRFFQPLQKEEWSIGVDTKSGKVVAFTHELAEDSTGASLSQDSAIVVAKTFLQQQGIDINAFTLKEKEDKARKARHDHTLTWEAPDGSPLNIDEAKYRITVQLAGGEISGLKRFMKLPEEWLREQDESTMITAGHTTLKVVIISGFMLFALWLFIKRVRAGEIAWKPSMRIAVLLVLVAAVEGAMSLPTVFSMYVTTMTTEQFWTVTLIGMAFAGIGIALGVTLLTGLAGSFYPDALASLKGMARRLRSGDAAIAALVYAGVMIGFRHAEALIGQMFPGSIESGHMSIPGGISTIVPMYGMISGALMSAVMGAASFGIAISIVFKEIRKPVILIPAAIVAALVMFIPDHGAPINMTVHFAERTLDMLITLALIKWILRDNVLSYLAALFVWGCVDAGIEYASFAAGFYKWNGIVTLVVAGIIILVLLIKSKRAAT